MFIDIELFISMDKVLLVTMSSNINDLLILVLSPVMRIYFSR